jgi:hypothetical protein
VRSIPVEKKSMEEQRRKPMDKEKTQNNSHHSSN